MNEKERNELARKEEKKERMPSAGAPAAPTLSADAVGFLRPCLRGRQWCPRPQPHRTRSWSACSAPSGRVPNTAFLLHLLSSNAGAIGPKTREALKTIADCVDALPTRRCRGSPFLPRMLSVIARYAVTIWMPPLNVFMIVLSDPPPVSRPLPRYHSRLCLLSIARSSHLTMTMTLVLQLTRVCPSRGPIPTTV